VEESESDARSIWGGYLAWLALVLGLGGCLAVVYSGVGYTLGNRDTQAWVLRALYPTCVSSVNGVQPGNYCE
jgi:hypothetical protein